MSELRSRKVSAIMKLMKWSKLMRYFSCACLMAGLLFLLSGSALAEMTYENIYTDISKPYAHYAAPGQHSDTENYKTAPRHAACVDCHDPHMATRSAAPMGSYFGSGTQSNISGVRPFYTSNPLEEPRYAFISSVVKEYELCFKCHSGYSNGTSVAKQFNPANTSYFPVIARGKNRNSALNSTFTPGWSIDSYVKCSDCHRSDAGTVDPNTNVKTYTVKGPHGSNIPGLLGRPSPSSDGWNPPAGYSRWRLRDSDWLGPYRSTDNICYDCHSYSYFGPYNGHPSTPHQGGAGGHRPPPFSIVSCKVCKIMPPHGSADTPFMMKLGYVEGQGPMFCANCHSTLRSMECRRPSCPRFYSYDRTGMETEEVRVHFQSARMKKGFEFDVPLPSPDIPTQKGLGVKDEYRYETRGDDYILFKEGKPKEDKGFYKVRFDQPEVGERPDGERVGEVGYEDSISLWTVDHKPDTQIYLTKDGEVISVKDEIKPKSATDSKGNDILPQISERTQKEEEKQGWFQGEVGYGNTVSEIYSRGNYFVLDFGDLSKARTIKLLWRVNESKGAKYPIYVQTLDSKGRWVTRGSARHAEDRYGALDITNFFPEGCKDFRLKIIPTLNSIDYMAVATSLESVKVTKLSLAKGEYYEYSREDKPKAVDITNTLSRRDKTYQKFDYLDSANLFFAVPEVDKTLTKRDFVFAPVGYFETGGPLSSRYEMTAMTAENSQGFATLKPAGGFANHYKVTLVDPDEWNERHGVKEQ